MAVKLKTIVEALAEGKNEFKTGIKMQSYYRMYDKKPLNEKRILVESKNGGDLAGNMFAILMELAQPAYQDFEVSLTIRKEKRSFFQNLLKKNHLERVKLIESGTRKYYKWLATAKYLFLDTSFSRDYIKKDGQIITNTWHGTPLKMMGTDVTNRVYAMGNVQRNLQMADYLVYPNRYMKDVMFRAYCLENIYNGTILWSGYPRNAVFFDEEKGKQLKKELGFEGKKVYVYMPTWRGTLTDMKSEVQVDELEYLLGQLDRQMDEDMILLAKLHPFVKDGLDFSQFEHVRSFPGEYDSYEVLNAADGLITDYSSVFFDFVNTRKKIILWAYDMEVYLGERGVYAELSSMPFPIVKGVRDLVAEMRSEKGYDESQFIKDYGYCDNPDAAHYVCQRVLLGNKLCPEEKQVHNGKDNVLFYVSTLAKNGITTSILSLLEYLDLTEKNYFAVFREKTFAPYPMRIEVLPKEFSVWPISAEPKLSLTDQFYSFLYYHCNVNSKLVRKRLDRIYRRENKRHFVDLHIDYAVHFTGYEKHVIKMFEKLDAERSIFVHNDMTQELKTKDNQHRLTLEEAYGSYDHVGIVSEDLRASTMELGAREDNLEVIYNCHAYETILKKGDMPIEFQKYTKLSVKQQVFLDALEDDSTKFINIGRFSGEKGHAMLIEAFDEYHETHPNTRLIIIGGYGELYGETLKLARKVKARNDIFIIRQIDNPIPILKKCDLFILSSFYEGFGLVLLEADTVGVPVVSTNIVGPSGFMRDHNGYMVEPTKEGLLEAMDAFEKGKIHSLGVDYESYNKNAARQFEKVIGKGK